MGFLSGLSGILGGGGQTKSSSQSGFGQLPKSIQDSFTGYANNFNSLIPGAAQAFTPLAQTQDETNAFDSIRQGFTPTAESLKSDIGMLTNPWNDFVLDPVNRQASGDYSILKQDLNSAGQFGSNRQRLGANDIEQTRLGTIGKLKQGQYDSAIGQVFNNLIPQRQQDAAGLLGIGDFQRNLSGQTAQAPYTGMLALAQALGALPKDGGSSQQSSSTTSTNGTAGNLISTIGGLSSFFSDRRLKENIELVGDSNGIPVYHFNYTGQPERFEGVMAQDILETHPDAVTMCDGYYAVDYSRIGIEMREVVKMADNLYNYPVGGIDKKAELREQAHA